MSPVVGMGVCMFFGREGERSPSKRKEKEGKFLLWGNVYVKEKCGLCGLVRKVANVLRTFGVGVAKVQLLDLSGPRHGRQQLEGILAVDLAVVDVELQESCLLYTSPSPRDLSTSRMPSSA